ncbi:MAG: hypothetical protein OXG68_14425 [Chloroflexi bacterium]|nr:hypothetical protein [Chloroflexota bacterium]
MRYLHPVQAHERFLASGSYRFVIDGAPLRKTESWAIHAHPDGERFIRVDVDAREDEGKSILAEALLSRDGALVRLDIRYENAKFQGGVKTLRAAYQIAGDRLQVGYNLNGAERKYVEAELPQAALVDIPLFVFRGRAISKMAAQPDRELAIYVPMFDYAQLFPGVLRKGFSPVEGLGEDTLHLGERQVSTRRYRYVDRAATYWIDRHDTIVKRVSSFKQREITVEISNYAVSERQRN